MNNKLNLWTITFIDKEGYMQFVEAETKEETLDVIETFKLSGQDLDHVSVFPPKSNITMEELI